MRLKDEIRCVPLNRNFPFSSLQLCCEPTTRSTALMASSCFWGLEQISRLIRDKPRTSPTVEALSPSPLPPDTFDLSRVATTCCLSSSSGPADPAVRWLRWIDRCGIPFPAAEGRSPDGAVRLRTTIRSFAIDESMAVAPRERVIAVVSDGASCVAASILTRSFVTLSMSVSTRMCSRASRG